MATGLLERAAQKLCAADDVAAAAEAYCRLGALHCRHLSLRDAAGAAAPPSAAAEALLARAAGAFEKALDLLPSDTQPVQSLLTRLDLTPRHVPRTTINEPCTASYM